MDFSQQVALVTGASSGIGQAIATGLAAAGADLCLAGRNLEVLNQLEARLRPSASSVRSYRVDLSVDEEIETLRKSVEADFNRLDILVHSAGVLALAPLETARINDFDWQFRVNVRAPSLLTQALLPLLKERKGQIVFVNSSVGLASKADNSQYAATKHALRAVADSLRDEVNHLGVRVLSVYPGRTATPMQEMLCRSEGKDYPADKLLQPEDVASVVINALSLPRTAEVTNISIRPMNKV